MKRALLMVAIYILFLGIAGCSPPEYNEYETLSQLCEQAENSEHVKISGVLKLPQVVLYDDRYLIQLVEDLNQDQSPLMLRINRGKGKS